MYMAAGPIIHPGSVGAIRMAVKSIRTASISPVPIVLADGPPSRNAIAIQPAGRLNPPPPTPMMPPASITGGVPD